MRVVAAVLLVLAFAGASAAQSPSSMVVVIKGESVGQKFDLDRELTVGREPSAGIFLDDGLVSRSHARFTLDG